MISLLVGDDALHHLTTAAEVNYPLQYATPDLRYFDQLLTDHLVLLSERAGRGFRRPLRLDAASLREVRESKRSRTTARVRAELLRYLLMDQAQMLNELRGEWHLTHQPSHVIVPNTEESQEPQEDTMAKTEKAAKPKKEKKAAKPKAEGSGNIAGDYDYTKTKIKTADGKSKVVVDNADRVAAVLRGSDEKALKGIAKENGMDWDPSKYKNPGLARMAFGNRLRALVRNPDVKVTIDGKSIASL
jgi:hypothetical protein